MCNLVGRHAAFTWRSLAAVHAASLLLFAALSAFACSAGQDASSGEKLESVKSELRKSQERESALKEELSLLTRQVTRLQNDFKLYSQKPCDFELDPIEYTIRKVAVRPVGDKGEAMLPASEPSAAGTEDVNARVRQSRQRIRACYLEAAKKNTSLQTVEKRVQLVFDLEPSGQLSGIMVSPPVGFGFEACVRKLLSNWKFTKFQGQPHRFRAWMNLRPQ